MGYSFTSPEVAWVPVRAKRRDVGVGVVLGWKASTGRDNNASKAAMNLLAGADTPVRIAGAYETLHDKMIAVDGRNTQAGSFDFSWTADRSNLENVLVVWDDPVLARNYLNRWTSRWAQGTD